MSNNQAARPPEEMAMKFVLSISFLMLAVSTALAQQAPAATAAPATASTTATAQTAPASTVAFTASATMPALKDNTQKDTFKVGIVDSQVSTQLQLVCAAGGSRFIVFHSDKACAITGSGAIFNPGNRQQLPRTQYLGGYVVKGDGSTDGSTMSVNYLGLGKVAPSQAAFSGSMNLKPELTSSGAQALANDVLKKIGADNTSGKLIDQRVDTVDINDLFIPSAGFPSDSGCKWRGHMVFAYQTNSWFLDLTANCAGKDYAFKGNMPWTNTPKVESQTQYDLTLTLPSAKATTDDALFAQSAGNGDLFSAVDGITGQIIMKQSNMVTVKVDGVDTPTPAQVDASGTLTGTNVPLDTVRSLSVLFGLLSENLFGA
jgi:hypothetical protein